MTKAKRAPNLALPPETDGEMVVTTIAMPTELWAEIKMRCVLERRTLRALCERALELYLKRPIERAEKASA